MGADAPRSPAGWRLAALLLLAAPLIQGGTPRLPTLLVEGGILFLMIGWAWSWARAPRRELSLCAADVLLGVLLFWSFFSLTFAPYYHAAEAASLAIACSVLLYWYLAFNPSYGGLALALGAVRAQAAFQALLVLGAAVARDADRPAGTFFNPNFLAGFLAASFLLALGDVLFPAPGRERPRWRPALAAAEALLLLSAVLATGSRGGALALFAGLLVLLALRSWKLTVAGVAASLAALLAIPNPLVRRLESLSSTDAFAFSRIDIWKSAWSMMLDHPWLGVGLGQFEYVSTRYAFPVNTHWAKYARVAESAHSEYLEAGADLGVPGLLLALGAVVLLAAAAWQRLRRLSPPARGPIATLLAAAAAVAVHAAVDFPLHAPPAALLIAVLAAGLRLHGATGPRREISFRVRPAYAAVAAVVALLFVAAAARPVLGYWHFLASLGAPQNLLREKWALEEAPRAKVPPAEAMRQLELAVRIDFVNAPYHRALGSLLFQRYLRGQGAPDDLRRSLYHLNYAAELNPNQYQYAMNLGQAMTSLARRQPPGRDQLAAALEHYRHAVELAPYQVSLHTEIGLLSDELGETAAAESAFRRAVAIEEYYLRGWHDLGTFYARHGRLADAREAFTRGAALAERAAALVPTTRAETEMLAVKPGIFYDGLKMIEAQEHRDGPAS